MLLYICQIRSFFVAKSGKLNNSIYCPTRHVKMLLAKFVRTFLQQTLSSTVRMSNRSMISMYLFNPVVMMLGHNVLYVIYFYH